MAIADWIREATERRRERITSDALNRGYLMGYEDRDKDKPLILPTDRINHNGDGDSGELK